MDLNKNTIAIAVGILVAGSPALAQTGPVRPAYEFPKGERGAGSVQLGDSPVFGLGYASAGVGYDSNIYTTNNAVDSGTEVYTVGARLDARDANSVFRMGIQSTYGRYNESHADDYSDWIIPTTYDIAFSPRNFLQLKFDYLRGHDPRGSTDRGVSGTPDKYFNSTPGIMYAYGAPGAQGRAELFASRAERRYLNNPETTYASNRNTKDYGGAFYWRVMPKTSLLAEARGTDIHYIDPASNRSSSESRYYGGVTWDATAATTGTIKVGQLSKRFDSNLPSSTEVSWEGLVSWLPRTYSKFDFYSSRQTVESTGLGNFTLSDATGVNWSHAWNSVLSTDVTAKYTKDRFEGATRTDETSVLGLRANYKFRRWLTLGAEYTYTTRDSSQTVYEYDRNLWLISAAMSM